MSLTLVLPFIERDASRLSHSLSRLALASTTSPVQQIILAYNGPLTEPAVRKVVGAISDAKVRIVTTSKQGIGAGYRTALEEASAEFTCLSASDLPFGTSDIDAFLKLKQAGDPSDKIYIGSKLHPRSDCAQRSPVRTLCTKVFSVARSLILPDKLPRDTQGTILGPTSVLRGLARSIRVDDFRFSLELVVRAVRQGITVDELPVKLELVDNGSSVRAWEVGSKLLIHCFELRRRTDP